MSHTDTAVEDFKKRDPGLYATYIGEGAAMERDRYRGIEAVAADLGSEHRPLIQAMKADGRYTGADLAKAAVMLRQGGANWSGDRLKVQREANADWQAKAPLRMAFDNNQKAYVAFRVAAAEQKGAKT